MPGNRALAKIPPANPRVFAPDCHISSGLNCSALRNFKPRGILSGSGVPPMIDNDEFRTPNPLSTVPFPPGKGLGVRFSRPRKQPVAPQTLALSTLYHDPKWQLPSEFPPSPPITMAKEISALAANSDAGGAASDTQSMPARSRSALAAFSWITLVARSVITMAAGFVATPYLLRFLGAERLGAFRASQQWTSYLTFLYLGLGPTLVVLLLRPASKGDLAGTVGVLKSGMRITMRQTLMFVLRGNRDQLVHAGTGRRVGFDAHRASLGNDARPRGFSPLAIGRVQIGARMPAVGMAGQCRSLDSSDRDFRDRSMARMARMGPARPVHRQRDRNRRLLGNLSIFRRQSLIRIHEHSPRRNRSHRAAVVAMANVLDRHRRPDEPCNRLHNSKPDRRSRRGRHILDHPAPDDRVGRLRFIVRRSELGRPRGTARRRRIGSVRAQSARGDQNVSAPGYACSQPSPPSINILSAFGSAFPTMAATPSPC